jgi:hypothetical protein
MDSLITAAARALAAGNPLGALKRVALRADASELALRADASELALRGIAMAQLGDFARAKELLRSAARLWSERSRGRACLPTPQSILGIPQFPVAGHNGGARQHHHNGPACRQQALSPAREGYLTIDQGREPSAAMTGAGTRKQRSGARPNGFSLTYRYFS